MRKLLAILLVAVLTLTLASMALNSGDEGRNPLTDSVDASPIGSYDDLQTDCSSGSDDVILTGNISGDTQLNIGRSLVLDLNGYTLTINVSADNGIKIGTGLTLTVRDSGGTGKLNVTSTATAVAGGAGINASEGTLVIESGTVAAKGSGYGAAIGGGVGETGGTITIIGGTITATLVENGIAAAIGGGMNGAGGSITIGGTAKVTAIGESNGAAIGGGNGANSGNITIGGSSEVNAAGRSNGAGIGGGQNHAADTILIADSAKVTATGGNNGAAIGGGNNGDGGNITINGGTVTATGGVNGAGIGKGAGTSNAAGTLKMNGNGTVFASSVSDSSAKTSGILFNGSIGTVYGSATPAEDLEVKSGATLTVTGGATLTIEDGTKLTNKGTLTVASGGAIVNNGEIANDGEVINNGTVSGDGDVNKKDQSPLNITDPGTQGYAPGKTVALVTTGGSGSGAVTYSVSGPGSIAPGSNILTLTGIGEIKLTATKAGDAFFYNPASAERTIQVEAALILSGTEGTDWTKNGRIYTIKDGATVTISGSSVDGTRVEVEVNGTANITLNSMSIDSSLADVSPFKLNAGASVILTLTGESILKAGSSGKTGLEVSSGTALIIAAGSTGSLTAEGGPGYAGIGGSSGDAGSITINGGTVTATGGQNGAGIGGGRNGAGGSITIGGTAKVTATGGTGAAGIGGGFRGTDGGVIEIGGDAEVTANGGGSGAGIGGGAGNLDGTGTGGDITINGTSKVTANGGQSAAGIGGGDYGGAGGTIEIGGDAEVTAIGGQNGAGIGGGTEGSGGDITIKDSAKVTATGDNAGSGIGGSNGGNCGTVIIEGGTVVATGGVYGAGIGGGFRGNCGTVIIKGGTVVATGGEGAGIGGGGNGGSGGQVTINGGIVTAASGNTSASAIGRGSFGSDDGSVSVTAGVYDWWTNTNMDGASGATKGSGDFTNDSAYKYVKVVAKSAVNNSGGAAAVTYAGLVFDLTLISGLFDIDPNAGGRTYTIESGGSPTGMGAIGEDGITLTVTKAGTFTIGLVTAETDTHGAGAMVTATLTVNKAIPADPTPPTASAIDYGETLSASELTGGSTGGSWAWTDGAVIPTVINSGYQAAFTPADTDNYDWAGITLDHSISVTVNKATVTITADSKSATVGGSAPAYTYTVAGLVSGETLAAEPTLTCAANMGVSGSYVIIPSGAAVPDADNYNEAITYVNGTLTVSPANPDSGDDDNDNDDNDDEDPDEETVYTVTDQPGEWVGTGSAAWKIDAPFSGYVGLLLNGGTVDASNYTVTEGSTVITLKESFLGTLADGGYTFRAEFTNGYADLGLSVDTQDPAESDGEDGGSMTLWLAIGGVIVLLFVIVCLLIWRKQKA